MGTQPNHLVVLGTFTGSGDEGVALITSQNPCDTRQLATHSASAEMAIGPLARMVGAVVRKFGPREKLHPFYHEILDRLEGAQDLLVEADALDNPDRRKAMGR